MTSSRTTVAAAAFAAALSTGTAPEAASVQVDGDCRTIRIRADGSRIVTPPRNRGRSGGTATVTTRNGSSVSMSSSSSSGSGRSVSTSTAGGVTVTITRDETGCTAVIDERSNKGSRE